MIIFLIILSIWILYWRTFNFYWLIDDIVPRQGYLYCVPETSPPPSFYSTKRRWIDGALAIFIHSINVFIVYLIWGWLPAILFAFSPLSVPCVAWATGNYYAVTTLFTLTSYYFLVTYPNFIGAFISSIFFTAALGSTITCLGFPFIFLLFNHWGLMLFWPMIMYLKGKRFTTGFRIRDMGKQDSFNLKKIPLMVKATAYYIHMVVFPYRLGFFRRYGEDYVRDEECKERMSRIDGWFWLSVFSILAFIVIGWQFSPVGVVWFLCLIGPFSQFKVLGQFVAERYIYLPSIGWYLILANALAPYPILLWTVVALYLLRSHFYIPAYEKMENLYEDGIRNFPDCLANYANLGERYIHTGRLKEGYEVLKKGLDLDPGNFLCYTNIAAYWIQIRDIDKGLYYTQKSIEVGKKKSSWYIVHAMREQWRNVLEFQKRYNKELRTTYSKEPTSYVWDGDKKAWLGLG